MKKPAPFRLASAVFLISVCLISTAAFADSRSDFQVLAGSNESFNYRDYYEVHEEARGGVIDLLNFDHVKQKFPKPARAYNRDRDFGGWLRDDTPESCLNTRGKVLLRDSQEDVSYSSNGCTVYTGAWDDPYTGRTYFDSREIQIDHIVALKNAYMTGAHEWGAAKRCLYANYMGNDFHLLSVNGRENLKKSDYSPADYVPPDRAYTCDFLRNWLSVKLIWTLRLTPPEKAAISRLAGENHCDLQMDAAALQEQRDYMAEHADLCAQAGLHFERF